MKKTILVLFLALLSGWASAQRVRTYVQEGFQGGPDYIHELEWDITESESSLEVLYYTPSQEAGGKEVWEGLLAYWPEYGMGKQLDGTYRYIFAKKNMVPGADNYVSVKYFYEADKNSVKNARIFGLAVRMAGGEWQNVMAVNDMPQNLGRGMLVGKLPDNMKNGRDIQFCVFYTTPKDNTKYLLYMDDIEFFACNAYGAEFGWEGLPFTANGQLDVDLSITNIGYEMQSCEISYTLDGGEVQTFPLTFEEDLFPGQVYVQENFVPEGWNAASYGKHKLEFWISKANGAEVSTQHQVKYLTNIDPATPAYQYRPLVEHFSASTCGPCANLNQYMNPVYEELGDTITMIKYQMNFPGAGDPYATDESIERGSYYRVGGVPFVVMEGKVLTVSGSSYAAAAAYLKDTMLAATNKKVYFDMWFDTAAMDADQNIHISLKIKAVGGVENVTLHTVVEEGTTHGNASTNGETEFHGVMMKMLPDVYGCAVSLLPDTVYTFNYVYDMTQTNMEEFTDLKVAAFLQTETGEVLQSVIRKAGSYTEGANVAVQADYVPSYICAEDIPAGLQLKSLGGTPVNSVEIEGKVGTAGTPKVQSYTVSIAWGESAYVTFDGLKATKTGADTVCFTLKKINGVAVDGQTVRCPVYVQPTQYAFVPLLEDFTNANNAGSAVLNQYVDALGNDVCQVKIPMKGDRYNRSVYTTYATKAGILTAPGLAMNGCVVRVASDGKLTDESYFESLLAQARRNTSIMKVNAKGDVVMNGLGINPEVLAQFNFESAMDVSCLLYAFVVEAKTEGNAGSNGEKPIKRVVQILFPEEGGGMKVSVSNGGLYILKKSTLNPQVENFNDLKLVLVFKDATGKEVLQTAEFPIVNNVPNERVAAYETLSVYPNPASEYVQLKALDNALLEVFDMNGHKVLGQNGISGDYTLDVRGYVPGAYIIKVSEGAKVSTARVNVVR